MIRSSYAPKLCRVGLWLTATAALGASAARAQGAPAPSSPGAVTTLSVTSSLVVLDVVVTDAKGSIVPGLKKEDFTLLQNDKPQRIRSFDDWTTRAQPAAAPTVDRFGHPDFGDLPLTLFVLDELNTPFDETSYSAFALEQYLQKQPSALSAPAMILQVDDKGLHTLISYTRDREALLQALAKRPPAFPGQFTAGANVELLAESFAILRQISLAAAGSHVHKNLLWIGRGFPSLSPGDFDNAANATLEKAMKDTVTLLTQSRITLYKIDPITTDARMPPTDLNSAIDAGSDLGASSNLSPASEDPFAGDFNFNHFAVQTGGRYFYGQNNLDQVIAGSLQRGSEFYTLSYVPPAAPDTIAYRSIKIRMRDPSLTAVTRQGFYAGEDVQPQPTLKNIGFDLSLAATGMMNYNGVDVRISAVTGSSAGNRITVSFAVEDRTLNWTPQSSGGEAAKITTLLVALDADHKIQASTTVSLGLAVKTPEEISRSLLNTQTQVTVNPKTRFLRLLIRDSSGRIGTADVNPADLNGLIAGAPTQPAQRK